MQWLTLHLDGCNGRFARAARPLQGVIMHATAADCAHTDPKVEQQQNRDQLAERIARIAILIPCLNEEQSVAEVVTQFRDQLPEASIFVFDNASTDGTVERARAAGAVVFSESRRGKGYVVQSMFRRVDADIYVMVDGDGTYPAVEVRRLIEPILKGEADMVVGSRLQPGTVSEFRLINRWANRLVLGVLNSMFRVKLTDILSGYRAFNRKFVKTLPVFGGGFEIETELTIKAVARGYRIIEIPTALKARSEGSHSKIKFLRDGLVILNTVLSLFRDYKPLTFFGSVGLALILFAAVGSLTELFEFYRRGTVARPILAVVALVVFFCGSLFVAVGLVLHSIARRSQELEYQIQVLGDELRGHARRPVDD